MRNYVDHTKLRCKQCGGKFTEQQLATARSKHSVAKYCSNRCKALSNMHNAVALQEPLSANEEIEIEQAIQQGIKEIETDLQKLLAKYTPPDDTPEAERLFREALCPNPLYGESVLTKYDIKTKDMGTRKAYTYSDE